MLNIQSANLALARLLCVAVALTTCAQPELQSAEANECVPIDRKGFEIKAPGRYCLQLDLSPRLNLPDRRSETYLLWIRSSSVDLDLNGKTVGRSVSAFGDAGGGIVIDKDVRNLVVRNGYIQNLSSCVARYDYETSKADDPIASTILNGNKIFFPELQFTFQNVVFKNCKYPLEFRLRKPG